MASDEVMTFDNMDDLKEIIEGEEEDDEEDDKTE